MHGDFIPAILGRLTQWGQIHVSVHDFAKIMCAVGDTDGDKIGGVAGIIPCRPTGAGDAVFAFEFVGVCHIGLPVAYPSIVETQASRNSRRRINMRVYNNLILRVSNSCIMPCLSCRALDSLPSRIECALYRAVFGMYITTNYFFGLLHVSWIIRKSIYSKAFGGMRICI